ncbi:3,4-dihydroxy-2-butanone-4-phosphate synthase [Mycobacterium pinniadriaticum]|uniref:3,4-dihydroxy-2-butanone-4-phosphate synthase n=1 Tax=Mycobacterium pinniadriaticum TaxID=2994102 RepID=UPI0038994331
MQLVIDPDTRPRDLGRPGRACPLTARSGIVLERTEHTRLSPPPTRCRTEGVGQSSGAQAFRSHPRSRRRQPIGHRRNPTGKSRASGGSSG